MGKRINKFSVQLIKESAKIYDLRTTTVRSPEDAKDAIQEVFQTDLMTREHFMMITLNTKNQIIGAHDLFSGSLNSSVVHPREVFQQAILNNAASIIVAHNHPSGDPSPSKEDIDVTKRLKECGKLLGIEVLDHLILGAVSGKWKSLKEGGYL